MAEEILRFEESSLHYTIEGTGPETLFLFHGFGQDRQVFESFSKSLSTTHTLYIFDLYFHGQSEWGRGELPLEKDLWKKTFKSLLELHHITKFSLCGFSLGGKFALATLEAFPTQTQAIVLIAPDGIKTSFWYSLATYPLLLRNLFRSMVLHPSRFLAISKILSSLGLMDKGLIRFAERQMDTEVKRRRVYFSWVVFRHFHFNHREIAALMNKYSIKLVLVTGKYDKVIRPDKMNRLLKHVRTYHHEILDSGHNGLIQASAVFFKKG